MLVLGAACSDGTSRIDLTFPESPDVGTQIMVVEQGTRLDAYVVALPSDRFDPDGSFDADVPARFTALIYHHPPEVLGLTPGRIELVDDGRPLPATDRMYVSIIDPGPELVGGGWTAVRDIDPTLRALRIPRDPKACTEWKVTRHVVESTSRPRFLMPLPDGDGLLFASGWWRVTVDGAARLPDADPPFNPSRGVLARDGHMYFGGFRGEMRRGEMRGDVVSTSSIGKAGNAHVKLIDAGTTPEGSEVLAVIDGGEVYRQRPGEPFQLVTTFDDTRGDLFGGVIWLAPGEGLVAHPQSNEPLRISGDDIRTELVTTTSGFTFGGWTDGFGPALGGLSTVAFMKDDKWTVHELEDIGHVMQVRRFRDRRVLGGYSGDVMELIEGRGFCPLQNITSVQIRFMIRLGDRALAVMGVETGGGDIARNLYVLEPLE